MRPAGGWTDAFLDEMRHLGDPPADEVARHIAREHSIQAMSKQLMELQKNKDVPADLDPILKEFVISSGRLPEWADNKKIERAETLFYDHGLMSIVGLFCGALPECYVVADEARVLDIAGQLEEHVELRIRETARMIFFVMDRGGMGPEGSGIHKIQKVRLIHAMIRHLMLDPPDHPRKGQELEAALAESRWDVSSQGQPISQEQLAYTLLTFHYVFIRGWRALGVPMTPEDEEAYLHCWNVAAQVLGLHRDLMPETMDEAAELFERIRERDVPRRTEDSVAAGRRLAKALVGLMAAAIPFGPMRPFAALLPRKLIGNADADLLGIDAHSGRLTRVLSRCAMAALHAVEALLGLVNSSYSVLRPLGRIVSQHLLRNLLLDETRPLDLPDHLLNRWSMDPDQHPLLRRLEVAFGGKSLSEIKRATQ